MGIIYSQLIYKPPYPAQSFAGRTVIVTGSNIGMGKEAARHFVRLDAERVILAVRNVRAGEEAKADIEQTTQRTGVAEVWKMDLSSYVSVKEFAVRLQRELNRLDVLVLNAAVATGKYDAPEGLETHVTVNVVGTFMLLFLLLPFMRETSASLGQGEERPHVALIGSGIHHWCELPPAEYPEGEILTQLSKPDGFPNAKRMVPANYIYTKLLQALLVRELAPQINPDEVIFNHNCPGLVQSGLRREWTGIMPTLMNLLARTSEVGSRTLLVGATIGKESHGQPLSDAKIQARSVRKQDTGFSQFVWSKDGELMGERVWKEVRAILEKEGVDVEAALAAK
jgi:NAD(P)-dependent dehydrogenase (short-subunit alcohol dehydrogenase family)